MKRIFLISVMLTAFIGMAYASSDPCADKTEDAKKLFAKCKAMDKSSSEYAQCKSSYNLLKNQVAQACRSGGINEDEMQSAIRQWKTQVDRCKGQTSSRCASALQQLGYYQYQLEEKQQLDKMASFDSLTAWCADRDNKPSQCGENLKTLPKPDHGKSLSYFLEYLDKYPKESKAPNVMFQVAAVYEANMDDDKAYDMRMRLVKMYPDNGLVPKAWLRIAEYHFMNRKYRDAIEAYKKVTGFSDLTGKEAALAMYHLAESYYNVADYEVAAMTYYNYITGADQGKYPRDLRQEAMDFMAVAFADMDDGVQVAAKFLKDKKVGFKDSLYYRIGMKNKDHDRNDEAVQAFRYLLDINPDYVDAPLADLAMVEILLIQQKPDEAQQQRYLVIKRYNDNSSWYQKNRKYPESVEAAERAIRSAMLDIPKYDHARAEKLWKGGDTEGAKKVYAQAVQGYSAFLQRYAKNPSWDEYVVHIYLAQLYQELSNFSKAAQMYDWIVFTDTTRYGRRPIGSESLLKKEEAGYDAVLMMDTSRALAQQQQAGGDPVKAYSLPETKAYFAEVDRYMKVFSKQKEAAELAYNAAIVHYNAKQYATAVTVLRKLRQDYPNHQYILLISRMLAQSLLESNQLDESQKEYEWLLKQYTEVKATRNDSMATVIRTAIAAVLYQRADQLVKKGQYEAGAQSYLALVKNYPLADFADKAVFAAGEAYEKGKAYTKAAEAFMLIPKQYAHSTLTIKAILRAALAYKNDKKPRDAAGTFLFITNNFPQDSMAFKAIGFAATTYDSIPDKKQAAQTYEIAYKKFPKNENTPGFLYSACLTYDEAKLTDEAIRCSKDLVRDYPKSSYALDAAFSIPIAYQDAKNWEQAAQEFINFSNAYTSDKGKLIAAYSGTARAYREMKEDDKANDYYKKTIDAYDKYGLQIKNADPTVAAEAAYYLGESQYQKMTPIALTGNDKAKAASVKKLMEYLKSAMSYYAKSAAYASEKWTFRATNKMGFLFVTMATKIREQELSSKTDEEKFAERIGIVQQLPSYYEQAMPIFQKNIDLARDQGFYNADVVAAEEGYIEMYYQGCAVFIEVADAFAKSPLPDSTSIVKEYMQNDGMTKDDAAAAAGDDLQAYRDELANRSKAAKDAGIPRCATGIKASAHYGIDNQWTKKLYDALQSLDTANEALTVKIQKFDASKLFQDPSYFKTKARIDQISKSDVMTPQEQLSTYRDIIKEAQDENAKLKEELQLLQQRRPSSAPAATPAPARN